MGGTSDIRPVDQAVGHRIQALRKKASLSVKDLSVALDVAQTQVLKFEAGEDQVSVTMLMKIADVLDVSMLDLFPQEARTKGMSKSQRFRNRTIDPTDCEIGQRIRYFRRNVGLSVVQVVEKVDLSHQKIQKYERGHDRITTGRLMALRALFDVPIVDFFPEQKKSFEGNAVETADLLRQINTPEGRELNEAFSRLKGSFLRQSIVAMANAIARAR